MHLPSISVCLCYLTSSTVAFSTLPYRTRTASGLDHHTQLARSSNAKGDWTFTQLNVASADTIPVEAMGRGIGGRIEKAFEAAKEKGEAAFVTFITAGYPTAEGKY